MYVLKALARLSRPLYIATAALTYTLGAGIARYLGIQTNAQVLVLGLLGAVLAQASMSLLAAVFRPFAEPLVQDETPEDRRLVRNAALYASVAALAVIVFIGFVNHAASSLTAATALNLGLSLLLILLYAVPPVRVVDRGYGELLVAAQLAYVVPSIGFLLQAGEYHPLLFACIVALTLLMVATLIALDFPGFAQDLKYERATLLTRMGWLNAMRLHHMLVIGTYLLLAMAALAGFSVELFLPAFLTIPFAALQVYLLRNLALGARPIWRLLSANAVALFMLTAYFLTLSFWFR